VHRARDFVRRHLAEHQLWYLVYDVGLVVSELAANAVFHARTPFTVSLQDGHQSVLLTVCDGSPEPAYCVNANVMDTSGPGLLIVDALSRDWGRHHRAGRIQVGVGVVRDPNRA
jgi:anti-sigma regulatory factor (Ser/Thr protein kinase)